MNKKPQKVRPLNWKKDLDWTEKGWTQSDKRSEARNEGIDPDQLSKSKKTQPNWDKNNTTDDNKDAQKLPIIRYLLFLIVTLSCVGAGGRYLANRSASTDANPHRTESSPLSSINEHLSLTVPKDTLYDLPPSTVAKKFALSSDAQERLKWARNPNDILQRLDQYSAHAREIPATKVSKLTKITTDSLTYETFLAEFPDGGRRFLCVIGTPDGPKVDWDAYARYGTACWDDLISGGITEGKVRVSPSKSSYYNGPYHNRENWNAYALSNPDLDLPVYGYCPKNSKIDLEMRHLIASGARRATLSIKRSTQQKEARQFEITSLNATGWVEK